MNNYEQQANDFLTKVGATITTEFKSNGKHFAGDKENRDIYSVTITKGKNRAYAFQFGQSINNSAFKIVNKNGKELRTFTVSNSQRAQYFKDGKWNLLQLRLYANQHVFQLSASETIQTPKEPTNYDILACLTTYDPGTFEDFCSEFGYDEDSKTAEKTYNAVKDEYKNVCMLFTDEEIELLSEIN